jgi:hypothetical protein
MSRSEEKDKDEKDEQNLDLASQKREFIQSFFRRGAEFAEELMRENERLRYRLVQLEEELRSVRGGDERSGSAGSALRELVARIEALESERAELLRRFEGVDQHSRDVVRRFEEIERENNNLANLYVASYQLHSTMDLKEVTQIILEILLNFVGAKTFAVQLIDAERHCLRTLAAEGVARDKVPELPLDQGPVAEVLKTRQPYVDATRLRERADLGRPVIVVPLSIRDSAVGAVVVWDLLVQKTTLLDVDYELFNLLGAHAASAIQGAKLTADLHDRPPALWTAVDLV